LTTVLDYGVTVVVTWLVLFDVFGSAGDVAVTVAVLTDVPFWSIDYASGSTSPVW
jgi:hypothetical protein